MHIGTTDRALVYSALVLYLFQFAACTGCGAGEKSAVVRHESRVKTKIPENRESEILIEKVPELREESERIVVPMRKDNGVYKIEVTVNGTPMDFIFDTGASVISISNVEASYLLKQGRISEDDVIGQGQFMDANGDVSTGIMLMLREVKIGTRTIRNIEAAVVNNTQAPLLLGQSALQKFGTVSIDYQNARIILE